MQGVFMRSKSNSGFQFSMMFPVLVALLVASSNIASVMSSLTVSRSSVVVIGERVEMKCSVTGNDSASWTYTAWKTSTETNIYLGRDIVASMRSRYRIEKTLNGQHDLVIDSVDLDHAGRYQCTAAMQQSMITAMQLTVLDSDPVCDANTSEAKESEEEQHHLRVSIWCSVNYSGDGLPIFNWTRRNGEKDIAANTTASGTSGKLLTRTSVIIQQLNTMESAHEVTFQCNITFNMPDNSQGVNVFVWHYALYGPRNLSIVRHEDRLECSADGNPVPTYRWIHVETNTSTYGSVLVLNGTFTTDKDQTFQCTAANMLATENINITIQGEVEDAGVPEGVPISTVVIGGSILLLLMIAILVSCVVHRKRLKDNASVNVSPKPSQGLTSQPPTYENTELGSSDTSANYCSLMDGPTASREPQVYCELRSYEQQGIKRPSSKQKTEIKDGVYANVSQL